jgi:hypothetical protein
MELEFSRRIFEEYSIIKFNENPSIGNPVVPSELAGGRTDRRTGKQT